MTQQPPSNPWRRGGQASLLQGGGCLRELTQSLCVRHLMTPSTALTCVSADVPVSVAVGRMSDQFDQLPVRAAGGQAIVGLLTRPSAEAAHGEATVAQAMARLAQSPPLASDACLPDAMEALAATPAVLVVDPGDATQVTGLLHYADFNRHPARVFFYLWLSALEMALVQLVEAYLRRQTLEVDDWLPHLSEHRQVTILGRYELSRRERIELAPLASAELADLLILCRCLQPLRHALGYGSKNAFDQSTSHLIPLRNAAMHPVRSLVGSHADLPQLLGRYHDLTRFLANVESLHQAWLREET